MKKDLKLLIIDEKDFPIENLSQFRLARSKALNAVETVHSKVTHDSGNRFMVIEGTAAEIKEIQKQLPNAKIVTLNSRFAQSISGLKLNPNEEIFVNALKIRTSAKFRKAKDLRKYGETTEEKNLLSGSCVRDVY